MRAAHPGQHRDVDVLVEAIVRGERPADLLSEPAWQSVEAAALLLSG
jgi:hypothetical protein